MFASTAFWRTGRSLSYVVAGLQTGSWAFLAFPFRDPACPERSRRDRSGPIFSSAPNYGASGRAARFVRPARFAGVEGSLCLSRQGMASVVPQNAPPNKNSSNSLFPRLAPCLSGISSASPLVHPERSPRRATRHLSSNRLGPLFPPTSFTKASGPRRGMG